MKYIIVAYDKRRVIGGGNRLLWEGMMRSDMRRVRQLTTGNAIIMGRNTFDSIGRALPNRQNIVVTHRPFEAEGVTVVPDIESGFAAVESGRDAYIFGGGQIYEQSLGLVDEILATEIGAIFDGDVKFPELGSEWVEVSRESHPADDENKFSYDFVTYRRA